MVLIRNSGRTGKITSNRGVNGFYYVEYQEGPVKVLQQIAEENLEDWTEAKDLTNIYRRYLFVRMEAFIGAKDLLEFSSNIVDARKLLTEAINKLAIKLNEPQTTETPDALHEEQLYCG